MGLKQDIEKLKKPDIYSILLFTLYKIKEIPEYSALSQLAYLLDEKNLLNLCEYFGGLTLKIPTIEDLEILIKALVIYQKVHIEKIDLEKAIEESAVNKFKIDNLKELYLSISSIMENYDFNSGDANDV